MGCFVRIITFGRGVHMFRRCMVIPGIRGLILPLAGVRVEWPEREFDGNPRAYIFNHSSTLDSLIMSAVPMPRPRFFLGRDVWMYLPQTVAAWAMGTFFIPPQNDRPGRVKCFRRAERELKKTGDSFVASAEGERVQGAVIGPFHKGVFHLAWAMRRNVVPLFIEIRPSDDPGLGFFFRPTTVRVHRLEEIHWGEGIDESEIDVLRDRCRERFIVAHVRYHGSASGHSE